MSEAIIRPRTRLEQKYDLEPHHGFKDHCSSCSGMGWNPSVAGSNWCSCFYKQPGDVQ